MTTALGIVLCAMALILLVAFLIAMSSCLKLRRLPAEKDAEISRLNGELEKAKAVEEVNLENLNRRLQDKEDGCRRLLAEKDEACQKLLAEKDRDCKRALQEKNEEIARLFDEQGKRFGETVKGLREQFANLAAQAMKTQGADLSQLNRTNMDAVLLPLREQMKRLEDATVKAQVASTSLGENMGKDVEAIGRIAQELSGVAHALSSDTRYQGRKGEEILAEKLRQAGLEENVNFFLQQGNDSDRPDAQVCDTENRWLIIDSKVSLTAYIEYMEAKDDTTRKEKLKAHVTSVRNKIDELAKKQYPRVFGNEHRDRNYLPVTAMFVGYEAPLMEALRAEPSLWQLAAQNNVVLITPLTLLAYIRLVYLAWQHEKEHRNQLEIVNTARELLTRTNNFLKVFEELGASIESLGDTYQKAKGIVVDAPHAHTIANSARKLIELNVRLEGRKGKKIEKAECLKEADEVEATVSSQDAN